ncbi:hypothetical protein ACHAPU_004325 [Fusarium lateritium]
MIEDGREDRHDGKQYSLGMNRVYDFGTTSQDIYLTFSHAHRPRAPGNFLVGWNDPRRQLHPHRDTRHEMDGHAQERPKEGQILGVDEDGKDSAGSKSVRELTDVGYRGNSQGISLIKMNNVL